MRSGWRHSRSTMSPTSNRLHQEGLGGSGLQPRRAENQSPGKGFHTCLPWAAHLGVSVTEPEPQGVLSREWMLAASLGRRPPAGRHSSPWAPQAWAHSLGQDPRSRSHGPEASPRGTPSSVGHSLSVPTRELGEQPLELSHRVSCPKFLPRWRLLDENSLAFPSPGAGSLQNPSWLGRLGEQFPRGPDKACWHGPHQTAGRDVPDPSARWAGPKLAMWSSGQSWHWGPYDAELRTGAGFPWEGGLPLLPSHPCLLPSWRQETCLRSS